MNTLIGTEVAGFTIVNTFESREYGVALGFKMWSNDKPEWATWVYTPGNEASFYAGHYNMNVEQAIDDFLERMPWSVRQPKTNDATKYDHYNEVRREYLKEDARHFVAEYLADYSGRSPWDISDEELSKYDYDKLVDMFEGRESTDVTFTDTWQNLIADYFEDEESEE